MSVDPSSLRIRLYPDPVLRLRARPVEPGDPEVAEVAARLIQLMCEAGGIGLAATQVGLAWRLFVAHVPPGDDRSSEDDPPSATEQPLVCINPALSEPSAELETREEGCLSLPDINGDVIRPARVTISATDLAGRAFSQRGQGLLARCWQHELDHLEGVLIIDRMTQISRMKNRAAVRDLERTAQHA